MPEAEYLQFGGQAIVEGVMMRSPRFFAVACRAPNGKVIVRTEQLEKTWIGRQKWLKLPFLRGSLAILDSMALGIRAMRFASNVQIDPKFAAPEEEPEAAADGTTAQPEAKAEAKELVIADPPSESMQSAYVIGAMIIGLGVGIFLFQVLPNLIAQIVGTKSGDQQGLMTNILTECVKLVIFVGYLWLISRLAEIQRVFRYHGAEHKAINVYEAHQELNRENTKKITRLHPRCGTSFAVIVFLVSFVLLPIVPRYPITGKPGSILIDASVRILLELCILPIIAGISYELLRIAGKWRNQKWVNIAFAPGLMSQKYLTTLEPDDSQVDVAVASLKAVIIAEESGTITDTDDYEASPIELKPAP